jgi:hypothetical protein
MIILRRYKIFSIACLGVRNFYAIWKSVDKEVFLYLFKDIMFAGFYFSQILRVAYHFGGLICRFVFALK